MENWGKRRRRECFQEGNAETYGAPYLSLDAQLLDTTGMGLDEPLSRTDFVSHKVGEVRSAPCYCVLFRA